MNRISSLVALFATCTALCACDKTEQRAQNAAASAEATADALGDRIENSADKAAAALTPTPSPQEFVNRAAQSDAFEIAAARIAAKNAISAQVKTFAEEMITAHTKSSAKIKMAASKANPAITPDPTFSEDQKEDLAELGRLTGAKFDEEYMDGQVDAHEDALALMRAFASDGADVGLKTAAQEIAPVVEGHLKMARDLDKRTDR